MIILTRLKKRIPKKVKIFLKPFYSLVAVKKRTELNFWREKYISENRDFNHSSYRKMMLAMAQEGDDSFLNDKIVADFGCGPRGSLAWIKSAKLKIGIDLLADKFADEFTNSIISHGMIYLKSTEKTIPLPSEFVDVVFSLNAMDHVNSFASMSDEILRILKKGGFFYCSFNLNEPKSVTEPQTLNESIIKDHLLNKMKIQSYRITNKGTGQNIYSPFFENKLKYEPGEEGLLWVKAEKR